MEKSSRKKKLLAISALLAIIAVLSGTFAWLGYNDARINRAASAKVTAGGVTIKETWEPEDLIAGKNAKKEVAVSNSGNANVFVRVSYEEVLKHLTNKGEVKYDGTNVVGAKYDPSAVNTDLGVHMPEVFNYEKTIDDGFLEVTGQVTGLAAGTKLFVKGGKTVDSVTNKETYSYDAKMAHEYATDEYQTMDFDIALDNENNSLNAVDWDFTVSDLKYGYYENGYHNTVINWATSASENEANPALVTGYSLLGTHGTRYNVAYDYQATALGVPLPTTTPATDINQVPVISGNQYNVQADTEGLEKSEIKIKYGDDMTDIATLADRKWVYNTIDGWFYFTQPLKPNETTPDLLKELIFTSSMGKEYTNASYDLVVKMEAIQATPEALTDSAGWNFGGGSTPTGNTLAIYNKLTGN